MKLIKDLLEKLVEYPSSDTVANPYLDQYAVDKHLAATLPQRFVAISGPDNRIGKIFIDYLRNGLGATTVSAWSARARPGLGVSVPIAWEELKSLTSSDHWTVSNIHSRLDKGNDPWAGYNTSAQSILSTMKVFGFKPKAQKLS